MVASEADASATMNERYFGDVCTHACDIDHCDDEAERYPNDNGSSTEANA